MTGTTKNNKLHRSDKADKQGNLVGCAQVSTQEKILDLQFDVLKAVGCERVLTYKIRGGPCKREGLYQAISFIWEGDTAPYLCHDSICACSCSSTVSTAPPPFSAYK